jgi:hypothetical protein
MLSMGVMMPLKRMPGIITKRPARKACCCVWLTVEMSRPRPSVADFSLYTTPSLAFPAWRHDPGGEAMRGMWVARNRHAKCPIGVALSRAAERH